VRLVDDFLHDSGKRNSGFSITRSVLILINGSWASLGLVTVLPHFGPEASRSAPFLAVLTGLAGRCGRWAVQNRHFAARENLVHRHLTFNKKEIGGEGWGATPTH
jgi:hypothetical protein